MSDGTITKEMCINGKFFQLSTSGYEFI